MSRLLSVAGASRLLGRDPRTVRRWLTDHPAICVQLGDRVWVREEALAKLIEALSPQGQALDVERGVQRQRDSSVARGCAE